MRLSCKVMLFKVVLTIGRWKTSLTSLTVVGALRDGNACLDQEWLMKCEQHRWHFSSQLITNLPLCHGPWYYMSLCFVNYLYFMHVL